jgi:hypothetical protein
MANIKIEDLDTLATGAAGDLFYTVDVSDTTDGAGGTGKHITTTTIATAMNVMTAGTAASEAAHVYVSAGASKAFVETPVEIDAGTGDMTGIGDVTADAVVATTLSVGGTTITASGTELNYTDGVTSAIQTQLDGKVPYSSGILTANVTLGETLGQIILDPALSADGKWSGIQEAGTAGATLAFGDLCYFAVADSRWELADADAEATAGPVKLGMCVLAAAADADPTNVLLIGKIRADAVFPALTVGAPVYAGTTAGDIQTSQPSGTDDVIRVIGYGVTADELWFNPCSTYITHT